MTTVHLDKVPLLEWIYRWIDVFTFFDHKIEIRSYAYELIDNKAMKGELKIQHPSLIAATAVYMSCEKYGVKFELNRINTIMKAYLAHRKMRSGLRHGFTGMERILERAKTWKSSLESK